jgi:hypothetical protein
VKALKFRFENIIVGVALLYAAFVYLMLPSEVITLNDDFGYLKSVISTLQHGRPWTNDWLAPWAASLSTSVGLLFLLTGKFHLAAYGLQSLLMGAAFWAAAHLLLRRGLGIAAALIVAALILTFPTVLWKSIEFTSMVFYIPCLLLALWATETRRWWFFALVWVLAVTSRQSALAWLALPGLEIVKALRNKNGAKSFWFGPALLIGGGMLFYYGFSLLMNKTHSQITVTDHAFEWVTFSAAAHTIAIGALVYFLALGWSSFVSQLRRPASLAGRWSWPAQGLLLLGAAALLIFDERKLLLVEHQSYDGGVGWFYVKLMVVLSIAGWLARGFIVSLEKMAYAAVCLALICVRGDLWDYYFLDIAIFGFFGVVYELGIADAPQRSPSVIPWAIWFPLSLVIALHAWTMLQFKFLLDRTYAQVVLAEHALRAGLVQPWEFGFAPFGYNGWYLHDYNIRHEGRTDTNIANFLRYVDWDALGLTIRYHGWIRALPGYAADPGVDPHPLVAAEQHRIAWFFHADYSLYRLKPMSVSGGSAPVLRKELVPWAFPLNDAEWQQLLVRSQVSSLAAATVAYADLPPYEKAIFRGIQPKPIRFYSTFGPELWNEDVPGSEQLSVHPETKLWFKLTSGRHHLTTTIEMVRSAYEGVPRSEATDGVEIVAAVTGANGDRTVLDHRLLNPRDIPADRGPQLIDWNFDLPSDATEFELSINAGPSGNAARDWTGLSPVTID